MRTYSGRISMGCHSVVVRDDGRDRLFDGGLSGDECTYWLRRPQPGTFNWGCHGRGSARLALALLADATGDEELARHYFERFAHIVAGMPQDDEFSMTDQQISDWLTRVSGAEDVSAEEATHV